MLAGRRYLQPAALRLRRGSAAAPTFEAWKEATGLPIVDGIGATEMLHIFIGSTPEDVQPGRDGPPGARL